MTDQQSLLAEWQKTDGGDPDDYDAIIINPHFFVDPESEYHADKLRFGFELVPDPDGDSADLIDFLAQIKRDSLERAVNVGGLDKGWNVSPDGDKAIDEKGKGFHQNSGMAAFQNSLFGCEGAVDAIVERGLLPVEAGAYANLRVHVQLEDVKGSGDVSDYKRLIITGFNGVVEQKKTTRKRAASKKAEAPSLTDEIRAAVDALADGHEEYEPFEAAATEQWGDNAEAMAYVTSEADDGAWNLAAVRAG